MNEEPTADRMRAHVWVSGRVQGVFFRAYAEDEAAYREGAGSICNVPDVRVEAVFEEDRTSVGPMIQWWHRGRPPLM